MAFPLLAAAAVGGISAGIGAYGRYKSAKANRPFQQKALKQKAFRQKAQTGYLKRYMADLRGRSANRARTELAMRPALRAIGAQQQKGQRQLSYQAAQQGLEGSGIEAQKQLALQAGTTQAVAGLGEKVLNQQLTQARQMQAQKEGQRMKLAGEIGRQESAVAEANRQAQFQTEESNRMAEFRATEANRAAQQQYDQSVSAAKGNIGLSILGGALQGATPGIGQLAQSALLGGGGGGGTNTVIGDFSNVPMDWDDDPLDVAGAGMGQGGVYTTSPYAAQGGKVTKAGIAHYYNGGNVEDLRVAVPGIVTGEEELYKTKQKEHDPKLAEHKKQLKIDAGAKKQFDIAQVALQKKDEEAKLLAEQQYEQTEKDRLSKIKSGYEEFTTSEAERKKKEALQFGEETETYEQTEKDRIAALTGETTPDQLRFTEHRKVLMTPEYQQLEEQSNILEKFNLGERQYANAQKLFEQNQKYGEEHTDKKYKNLEDFIANSKVGKRNWGEDSETKDVEYGTLSKRNKKKLTKKLDKKKLALMKAAGFETGEFKPTATEEDIQKQITPTEKPEYEFEPGEYKTEEELAGLSGEEIDKLIPKKPTEKEFVKEEYKPKYTAEAPTLQAPTEKELGRMRTWEIFKQLQAGVDVGANIAKAKTNREATDFFKQFSAGTMTTDQIWSHPWAADNAKQVATLISQGQKAQQTLVKAEQKQYADKEKVRTNITGHLFNLDQITAAGEPINVDDPNTPEDESLTATPGENINTIVENNPDGITSSQLSTLLSHVDEIKQSVEGEPLDISAYNPDDPIGSLAAILGVNEQAGGSKEVTKLLKELMKLPLIAQEGMLAETIEQTPTSGTKQTGGFNFK